MPMDWSLRQISQHAFHALVGQQEQVALVRPVRLDVLQMPPEATVPYVA